MTRDTSSGDPDGGCPLRYRILLILLLAAGGCTRAAPSTAATPGLGCAVGDTALVRDVLYFGRNIPGGGVVSDSAWQDFVDGTVTSRFPAGFTVWDAAGQWRGASGQVESERSKVLTLLHPGDSTSERQLAEAVSEYKRRFSQEAVLRERMTACSRF